MITERKPDFLAYSAWLNEQGGDNREDLERAKRALKIALRDCVTDKQREYLTLYFAERLSMPEIASLYGVNKGTVSRVIHSGLRRLYGYLRFSPPIFLDCPERKVCVRNGNRGRRAGLEVVDDKGRGR